MKMHYCDKRHCFGIIIIFYIHYQIQSLDLGFATSGSTHALWGAALCSFEHDVVAVSEGK